MANLLKENAYHVLGLDTSANQRDIQRRAKEITAHLKVEDTPEYDLDLGIFENYRTENLVKDALQRLTSPKKYIKEFFFWFSNKDSVDESALAALKTRDFEKAIGIWQKSAEKNSGAALLHQKNLAILYCILLFRENNAEYLDSSLELWKSLIKSDKFWSTFSKLYKTQDELGSDQAIIDSWREQCANDIAEIYAQLGSAWGDNVFVSKSVNELSIRSKTADKEVFDPIYQNVIETVEKLESLEVSADGILDEEETRTIKELVTKLQDDFNKLVDLGVYEDSQSKTIRDQAASAIRTLVLDLHNNLSETDKSIALMNIAAKLVGTAGLASKIEHEIKVLEETKEHTELVKPVADLIEEEKYEEALRQIEIDKGKYKDNSNLQEVYDNQKKLAITMMAMDKYRRARELFNNQNEDAAKLLFHEAGSLVYENMELFSFNKSVVDEIIDDIKSNLEKVSINNLDQFDKYRDSYVQLAKKNFEGSLEEAALIILVDSQLFSGLTDFIKSTKKKTNVANVLFILGWLTIWFYGIGLLFFIAGWIYKHSSE